MPNWERPGPPLVFASRTFSSLFKSIKTRTSKVSASSHVLSRLAAGETLRALWMSNLQKCLFSSFSLKGNIKSFLKKKNRKKRPFTQPKLKYSQVLGLFPSCLFLLRKARGPFDHFNFKMQLTPVKTQRSPALVLFGLTHFLAICYSRKLRTQIRDGKTGNQMVFFIFGRGAS